MNSDKAKKGYMHSPHRSLLKAAGYTDWEIERPWIGIANAYNAVIPGHVHLRSITEAVKAGIYAAGGLPIEFPVIGVCDGIAMNHEGIRHGHGSRRAQPALRRHIRRPDDGGTEQRQSPRPQQRI